MVYRLAMVTVYVTKRITKKDPQKGVLKQYNFTQKGQNISETLSLVGKQQQNHKRVSGAKIVIISCMH